MEQKKGKNSFIMYDEYKSHFEMLRTPDEVVELIFAMFDYHMHGEIKPLSPVVSMAFSFIRNNLDRDKAKYKVICERNSVNGPKGGRPKKTQDNPDNPLGLLETQNNPAEPKEPDNENDNENDNEKKENKKSIKKKLPDTNQAKLDGLLTHEYFKNEQFSELWGDFCKSRGSKYTVIAKKNALMKLFRYDLDTCIACVETSVSGGYAGLFPESVKTSKNAVGFTQFKSASEKTKDAVDEWAKSEGIFEESRVVDAQIITPKLMEGGQ